MPVRVQRPDGSIETPLKKEEPDLAALRSRIAEVLRREGKPRVPRSSRSGPDPRAEAKDQLAQERDRRAQDVIEHHQWITAGTVFANPFPRSTSWPEGRSAAPDDLRASPALGYASHGGPGPESAAQMIHPALKLGLIEAATSLVAGLFK